ncbi:hypothetical protein AB4Z34_01610 [Ensifer sp. 2YAB10]|uniref:hypothetical protein n=1 Tax=unclassified Ensifer TaxID=2633371 RepID=UPI003F91E8B8
MSDNKNEQAKCWMTGTTFEIGDVVTRGPDIFPPVDWSCRRISSCATLTADRMSA